MTHVAVARNRGAVNVPSDVRQYQGHHLRGEDSPSGQSHRTNLTEDLRIQEDGQDKLLALPRPRGCGIGLGPRGL